MKHRKPDAQLPLPSLPPDNGARVIALPRPATPAARRPSLASPGNPRRPALWYALYFPQLAALAPARQQVLLQALAAQAQLISGTVSFHPQSLVCEVRSSLRYFGDLETIHRRLHPALSCCLETQQLPPDYFYAACPTVTGSLLLARAGHNVLVYRHDNLRSALGQLPAEVLQLDPEQQRRLHNMGVRHLRDIWRLPSDGLRKRFGSDFVSQLDKALGLTPEPTRNYIPSPDFSTSHELPYELENLDRLLPIADEMLAQLCDFLRRRDLSVSHLRFTLVHENREGSCVTLGLRQPSRDRAHLLMLLETRFNSLALPAPVVALRLSVRQFDAHTPDNESLLAGQAATEKQGASNLDLFMEQLQARLGQQPVKSIKAVAEHCPEYACQHQTYEAGMQAAGVPASADVAGNPRPFWLLPAPLPLTLKNGRLYHRRSLQLLSGPERIETRWWSGSDIRRDYYVAREAGGSRLWIFRERSAARRWYLHGVFS